MSTHNLCFRAKVRKIMYMSVHCSFTIQKWGLLRGLRLHGGVILMLFFISPEKETRKTDFLVIRLLM